MAKTQLLRDGTARRGKALAAELTKCEKEIERLTEAIKPRRFGPLLAAIRDSGRSSRVRANRSRCSTVRHARRSWTSTLCV
jgi:hypothetical protein